MRLYYFLFPALILSINSIAQKVNYKWNIETNYSIIPEEGFGGKSNIIELGLKYRFINSELLNLGVSFNTGYSQKNLDEFNIEGKIKSYYFQPRLISELYIPSLVRLRPTIGLGYSIVNENSSSISMGKEESINTTNGGFNLNLGLIYNISNRFFVQTQYDFINLNVRDEYTIQGELVNPNFNEKLNNLKVGIGLRFN